MRRLHEVVDDAGEPASLVGWSLGGLAAMRWALDAPASLKSLTLVASSPCFVQRADWPHAQATCP